MSISTGDSNKNISDPSTPAPSSPASNPLSSSSGMESPPPSIHQTPTTLDELLRFSGIPEGKHEEYLTKFRNHDIDDSCMGALTDDQLKEIGISVGHRMRMLKCQQGPGNKPNVITRYESGEIQEVKVIGRGTFGMVYKGKTMHGGLVAVKKVFMQHSKESLIASFYTELELLKTMKHPNIVRLLGYTISSNELCLVMELYDCNLRKLIDDKVRDADSWQREKKGGKEERKKLTHINIWFQ